MSAPAVTWLMWFELSDEQKTQALRLTGTDDDPRAYDYGLSEDGRPIVSKFTGYVPERRHLYA